MMEGWRCAACRKLLAERAPAGTVIRCPRCKTVNRA